MEDFLIPVVLVLFIVLWVWSILDLVFSTFRKSKWKLAWLLILVFFPLLGSILYLILRKEFKAGPRKFNPRFDGAGKVIRRD